MAETAVKKYDFDKFIFLVSKIPPHKKLHSESFNHRFNMASIGARSLNEKVFNNKSIFEVSDIESKLDGKSYTYNSLIELKKIYKNDRFTFLTGSDIFSSIALWYNYKELFILTDFLIGLRPGVNFEEMYEKLPIEVVNKIKNKEGIYLLELDSIPISSSEIRGDLREHFEYIPENIVNYIKENNLYK